MTAPVLTYEPYSTSKFVDVPMDAEGWPLDKTLSDLEHELRNYREAAGYENELGAQQVREMISAYCESHFFCQDCKEYLPVCEEAWSKGICLDCRGDV